MGLFYFTGKDQDVEKENCDERRKHQRETAGHLKLDHRKNPGGRCAGKTE